MPIIVNLDVMLAKRKMRSKELAERVDLTEQNISLLDTLERICSVLSCQPGDLLEYRPECPPPSNDS
jgi:putative transcriptional regulator